MRKSFLTFMLTLLAGVLFAPVHLLIQMSDGGTPKKELTKYYERLQDHDR